MNDKSIDRGFRVSVWIITIGALMVIVGTVGKLLSR